MLPTSAFWKLAYNLHTVSCSHLKCVLQSVLMSEIRQNISLTPEIPFCPIPIHVLFQRCHWSDFSAFYQLTYSRFPFRVSHKGSSCCELLLSLSRIFEDPSIPLNVPWCRLLVDDLESILCAHHTLYFHSLVNRCMGVLFELLGTKLW